MTRQKLGWDEREITFLVENIESLGVESVAEKLQKPRNVVTLKARSLGFKVDDKPQNPDWYLQMPFQATDGFMSGWKVVYGENPKCSDCDIDLRVGDFVQWVGKRDAKRLVCRRCGDGELQRTGS